MTCALPPHVAQTELERTVVPMRGGEQRIGHGMGVLSDNDDVTMLPRDDEMCTYAVSYVAAGRKGVGGNQGPNGIVKGH